MRRGLPASQRIYAIGDIHGCATLFQRLLMKIDRDIAERAPALITLVLLGDLIDRGERSAELVRLVMKIGLNERLVILKGNHEAAMVDAYRGDLDALALWLEHGGVATLRGFGLEAGALADVGPVEAVRLVRDTIPRDVIDWAAALPTHYRAGPYFFAHAGVRPGVKLAQQSEHDLLWIREPFLQSDDDLGAIVVHGHSIESDAVVERANRIGVDTGAYRTGRLSAVALEGTEHWTLVVSDQDESRASRLNDLAL